MMSELVQLHPPLNPERLAEFSQRWRCAVLRALEIGGDSFQLLLGTLGADDPAGLLYRIADMVPADSAVARAPNPGSASRSDAYGRLLDALAPEAENGFRGAVGAAYGDWVCHRSKARPGDTQAALFRAFCAQIPADKARLLERHFQAAADPVSRLRDAYWSMADREPVIVPGRGLVCRPTYTGPREARAARSFAPRHGQVVFHSQSERRGRPAATWFRQTAHGQTRMVPGLCPELAARIEPRIAAAPLTVTGRIGARAVVPVTPGLWYDEVVVARALAAEGDDLVWDAWSSAGRWSSFFGRTGKLARHVSHLVLVAGADLTLTCHGRFDDTDLAAIRQALPGGFWPFLGADRRSSPDLGFRAEPDGGFSVQYQQVRPECWGALIEFAAL